MRVGIGSNSNGRERWKARGRRGLIEIWSAGEEVGKVGRQLRGRRSTQCLVRELGRRREELLGCKVKQGLDGAKRIDAGAAGWDSFEPSPHRNLQSAMPRH